MHRPHEAQEEDQSVDISVLLRKGIKLSIGGDTETKCGAETEGKTTVFKHMVSFPLQTQIAST